MKRLLTALVLLAALFPCACASAQTIIYDDVKNTIVLTDLSETMPEEIAGAFAPLLREGDTVLSGKYAVTHSVRPEYGILNEKAVLAVSRGDAVLLMGGFRDEDRNNGDWQVMLETDSFIPAGRDFTVEYLPLPNHDVTQYAFALVMEGETWHIRVYDSGMLVPDTVGFMHADGTRTRIEIASRGLVPVTISGGAVERGELLRCCAPERLAAIDFAAFPRTGEQVKQYAAAHQPKLAPGQAYICGVNLRERPTGESRSLGVYAARVDVLGSEPGKYFPWYHVRLGDTVGYVSGDYVINEQNGDDVRYYGMGEFVSPPARADGETALYLAPGGEIKQTLAPGTMMHVLEEKNGYLHVVIPRGEITPFADWDGTYGYVRAGDITRGKTLAELRWK